MPGGPDPKARLARAGMAALCVLVAVAGCVPQQSALHPAGSDAVAVARLFWGMTAAGAAIWLIVMGITLYAVIGRRRPRSDRFADRFIFLGGVVFPTVTLAALLAYGLTLLPAWTEDAPHLRVHVRAEQFWWRVTYERPGQAPVESANEVHLPAQGVTEFVLTSPDVIHSFWVPALGGKMDAIPGRETRLRLTPTDPGRYRGVCAEFCGLSHALMAFDVVVHAPADFDRWLAAEAMPALEKAGGQAGEQAGGQAGGQAGALGRALDRAGCPACHTVRGVAERARLGPDLTHLASRRHIAAGILPNTAANLRLWLTDPQSVKPGVHMPPFAALPEAELAALIAALQGLK